MYAFSDGVPVFILIVPPNAPPPFVEGPTPLWIWMVLVDEAISGKSTQKTPWDSASLYGIPLIVTLILFASLPLILIPVYPIPPPASDVIVTDGVKSNKYGISLPVLFLFSSYNVRFS